MKATILQNLTRKSPLAELKKVKPKADGAKNKKSLYFALNLTTLIDAFCILVIFLLSNMNGRVQNIQQSEKITLPFAVKSELLENGLLVKLVDDTILIDEKPVGKNELVSFLIKSFQKEKNSLIIQADRNSDYDKIAYVMKAGGIAGYEKYVFAVLPGT